MDARTDDQTNISAQLVDMRLNRAVYGVTGTLAAVVLMHLAKAPSWAFALLFVPFFVTLNLAFQGMFKTCNYMAMRNMRDLGDGHEKIANPEQAACMRARGVRVLLLSFVSSAAVTVLAVWAARG